MWETLPPLSGAAVKFSTGQSPGRVRLNPLPTLFGCTVQLRTTVAPGAMNVSQHDGPELQDVPGGIFVTVQLAPLLNAAWQTPLAAFCATKQFASVAVRSTGLLLM